MANQKAMYRSLASLHRAGVAWPQALESAAPGRLAAAQKALRDGKPLSEALTGEVDALDIAMIRAGESSGTLEETFARLAQRHDDEARRRAEMRSAVLYPILLAHIGAVLLGVPDLIQRRYTAALGWAALLMGPCWIWMWLAHKSGRVRHGRDPKPPRFVHPLNASGIEDADSRALLALADCLDGAVPLPETLRLAARAGAGGRVAADLAFAAVGVQQGKRISEFFKYTPSEIGRSLRVAEDSGDLSRVARECADHFAFSARMRRERIRSILPIFMMLTIGGLIAYRIISFYANAMRMVR